MPFPDHCLLVPFSRIKDKCRAISQDIRYLIIIIIIITIIIIIIIIIIIQECQRIFYFPSRSNNLTLNVGDQVLE